MKQGPLKNTEREQKQYDRATRDLMRMFTKLFIVAVITVSVLAGGMYVFFIKNKTMGIVLMVIGAIILLVSILTSLNIRAYIKKYKQ